MNTPYDILTYESALTEGEKNICEILRKEIESSIPEATSKVWHGHPVWFLEGNPIVGYSKRKNEIELLFWSGQSFDEAGLINTGSFKAAKKGYTTLDTVDITDLSHWLTKSRVIQWDYANIVKRKGRLERLQ